MEIKANISFSFLSLSDVLRYKHTLFSMYPNRIAIKLLAHLFYPSGYSRIYRLIFRPVIWFYLYVVEWILEVVHDWSDIVFEETQELIQLLFGKIDSIAILFSQYFVGLLFLKVSHCVFCDHGADPHKVMDLILC